MKTADSYARITLCFVSMLLGVAGFVREGVAAENKSGLPPLTASAQKSGAASAYKLGVCRAINNPIQIVPTGHAGDYLHEYLHKNFDFDFTPDGGDRTDTSVRIIGQPKHGRLVQQYPDATDYQEFMYQYIPDANFEGYDKFVMEVSAGGNTVQIYYTMGVASGPIGGMNEQGERTDSSLCDRPHWKISAILDSNGNTTITSVEYQSIKGIGGGGLEL